jgi:hypothetical protein
MEDIEIEEFVACWQRDGFSDSLRRMHEHYANADLPSEPSEEPTADEALGSTAVSHEREVALAAGLQILADPDNPPRQTREPPDEPVVTAPDQPSEQSAEVQASTSNDLIILADPGNQPKQTREPPKRIIPRAGRVPIDITSPEAKRMLERMRPRSLAEIAAIKPPQWIIARHIPENSLIALFGRFSTCKSFLARPGGSVSQPASRGWGGVSNRGMSSTSPPKAPPASSSAPPPSAKKTA